MGGGVDEVLRAGLGFGIPRIGAGLDAGRIGGHDPETGVGQGLFDLFVLRVCRIQILQDLACRLFVDVHAQHERLGQRPVDGGHLHRTFGFLEVGQRGANKPSRASAVPSAILAACE